MSQALRILALVAALLFANAALAQWGPWPGQSGNGAGYANAPGWPGSFTATACAAPTSGSSWATATVRSNCTYSTSSANNTNCNFCIFEYVDFKSTATANNNVLASGSNQLYIGCRFQSNYQAGANVSAAGNNQTYLYDTWVPLLTLYTSPPGFVQWPGAGVLQNTTTQTSGVNAVATNQGYDFGLFVNAGKSGITVDHGEFWGFGDAIVIDSSSNFITATSNYIHDDAYPVGNTGGTYHSDCVGYLNGAAGPNNVMIFGNTCAFLGNTNLIAFQANTSATQYQNIFVNENFLSGDNASIAWCRSISCTNSPFYGNVFGTDIEDFGVIDTGASVGTGSVWACNTIEFLAGTAWTTPPKPPGNNDGWNPTSGMNGQFLLDASLPNSATDQGGNTHCAITSPAAYDFGFVGVGSSSATQTVTLTNTNTASITVSSAAMATGTNFSVVSNGCTTLTAGANCAITVKFNPGAQGPLTDTLQITDNTTGVTSPQLVPLLGVGTTGSPTVATPTFSPTPGSYGATQTVSLSDSTPSAAICYTLNGSTPTAATPGTCDSNGGVEFTYSTTLTVSSTKTIKALGTLSGDSNSSVASGTFTINGAIATPTLSPTGGTFTSTQNVTLSDSVGGATLCFTTDGSTPTGNGAGTCTHGSTYSATIAVATSLTIKAIATESGYLDSSVASGVFVINSVLPNAGAAGAFMGQ